MADFKRYLVVVRLSAAETGLGLLAERVTAIRSILAWISRGAVNLIFSTKDAELFGLQVDTTRAAAELRAAVEGGQVLGGQSWIMVLELGPTMAASPGNSSGWRHLQQPLPK